MEISKPIANQPDALNQPESTSQLADRVDTQIEMPTPQVPGNLDRWASLIAGGALVIAGLQQRSLRGAIMAVVGGGLAYRGVTVQDSNPDALSERSIKVEKTVTINKSPEELYRFWRNFENLPRFMKHLKYVKVWDEKRSHWIMSAPLENSVEWDAEILEDRENQLIAWASVDNANVDTSGFVRFQKAPGDSLRDSSLLRSRSANASRGTEVKLVIEYNPPGGVLGAAVAKLFGEELEQQLSEDLRRFKQLMEAAEIATTEGQTSCRK